MRMESIFIDLVSSYMHFQSPIYLKRYTNTHDTSRFANAIHWFASIFPINVFFPNELKHFESETREIHTQFMTKLDGFCLSLRRKSSRKSLFLMQFATEINYCKSWNVAYFLYFHVTFSWNEFVAWTSTYTRLHLHHFIWCLHNGLMQKKDEHSRSFHKTIYCILAKMLNTSAVISYSWTK